VGFWFLADSCDRLFANSEMGIPHSRSLNVSNRNSSWNWNLVWSLVMDIVERLREFEATDCCSQRKEAADEIERFRKVLNSDNQTIRLHLGELTPQEMRTVKSAFLWVLSCAALKEKE
jgi:hypothetical protein